MSSQTSPNITGKFADDDVWPVILRTRDDSNLAIIPSDLSKDELINVLRQFSEQLDKPLPEGDEKVFLQSTIDDADELFALTNDVSARGRALRAAVSDLLDAAYPVELRNDLDTVATVALAFSEYVPEGLSLQSIAEIYYQDNAEAAFKAFTDLISIGMSEYVDVIVLNEEVCLPLEVIDRAESGLESKIDRAEDVVDQLAEYRED